MDLDIRHSGSVCVLKIKGGLKYGEGVTSLEKTVDSALESGRTQIVLNLEAMPVIDSCGSDIVNTLRRAMKAGGRRCKTGKSVFVCR